MKTILLPLTAMWLLFSSMLATPAHGKALELFVQPQTGGMFGLSTFESLPWKDSSHKLNTEEDYFMTHRGPTAGISAGLEFLFVDVVLGVNQFYQSTNRSTLFTVQVGLDADFDISPTSVWTIYLFGGFGIGTIDNGWLEKEEIQVAKNDLYAQIFFLRAGFRYEYKFTEMIRLAVDAGVGAHVLTLAYKAVNEDEAQTAGIHAYAMGGLRFYFDFFGKKDEPKDVSLPEAKPQPAPAQPAAVQPAPAQPAAATPASAAPTGSAPNTTP
ncbi:hypothetical protein KKF84_11285 [Myxococcota bacterium]|nr:hypothetical protein [Myxococcota bacterium]MBU1535894.1 hypothetical protein [Myxococcota bacterium]